MSTDPLPNTMDLYRQACNVADWANAAGTSLENQQALYEAAAKLRDTIGRMRVGAAPAPQTTEPKPEAGVVEALRIVAKMRADLTALGGFENELVGVNAGGIRNYIVALEAALAAQTAERVAAGLTDNIRAALIDYYTALDRREHGGVAAHRALARIEAAFGMTWTDRASWAANDLTAPEGGK